MWSFFQTKVKKANRKIQPNCSQVLTDVHYNESYDSVISEGDLAGVHNSDVYVRQSKSWLHLAFSETEWEHDEKMARSCQKKKKLSH